MSIFGKNRALQPKRAGRGADSAPTTTFEIGSIHKRSRERTKSITEAPLPAVTDSGGGIKITEKQLRGELFFHGERSLMIAR